jgi:DNA-binding transcriptional LysR family regulator
MFEKQIYYFILIMEHGMSFTKAAIALNISQPALSKHISVLESKLGVALFDTAKRTAIKLTPAGQLLLEYFIDGSKKFSAVLSEARKLDRDYEREYGRREKAAQRTLQRTSRRASQRVAS